MHKVDLLIIGGGLAGLQMALQCELHNKTYLIVDDDRPSATSAAAGLINPITGRNYVKTWNYDALISAAKEVYAQWSQLLGQPVLKALEIRRVLNTISEENKWFSRLSDPQYQPLMDKHWESTSSQCRLKGNEKVVRLSEAFRLDTHLLLSLAHARFINEKKLLHDQFNFEKFHADSLEWKGIKYQHLVFCRGGYEAGQPFDFLPIVPNLGEVLLIRIPAEQSFDYAIKKNLFIVPFTGNLHWIGGTYRNLTKEPNSQPDFSILESRLAEMALFDYEIVNRISGIRGTSPDRKPMIGIHPDQSHLSIFNGLGTKGASLSPLYAKQLFQKIHNFKSDIDPEVNILRYLSKN